MGSKTSWLYSFQDSCWSLLQPAPDLPCLVLRAEAGRLRKITQVWKIALILLVLAASIGTSVCLCVWLLFTWAWKSGFGNKGSLFGRIWGTAPCSGAVIHWLFQEITSVLQQPGCIHVAQPQQDSSFTCTHISETTLLKPGDMRWQPELE